MFDMNTFQLMAVPTFFELTTDKGVCYLNLYENSEYGCEYEFYDYECNEIDGGVFDDYRDEFGDSLEKLVYSIIADANMNLVGIKKVADVKAREIEKRAEEVFWEKFKRGVKRTQVGE